MKVHARTLLAAIAAGAHDLATLQQRTRAGTGCGTCRIDLLQILARHAPAGTGPKTSDW
jgi:nitrite reductase (NADH) large subunit